jgi:hypothetical protein
MIESHVLPINRKYFLVGCVTECWHLEWEELQCLVINGSIFFGEICWLAGALVKGNFVIVIEEFTVESANNHDAIFAHLAHACSLSGCYHILMMDVEFFPLEVEIR